MPTTLSPAFFPHIFEDILRLTDRPTLLAARLVSTAMCDSANRLLSSDYLILETYAMENHIELLAFSDGSPSEDCISSCRTVPYFHPTANLTAQYQAVNRARILRLFINCNFARRRLNSLLQQVHPSCEVELWCDTLHDLSFATDICLPACATLSLQSSMSCSCSGRVPPESTAVEAPGVLRHNASRVRLYVESESVTDTTSSTVCYRCPLVAGAVNGGVTHLTVSGNVCALPRHFQNVNVNSSPDLQILIEGDGGLGPAAVNSLRQATAQHFKIPVEQVQYTFDCSRVH
ncbi:hypothetical protein A1Q1_04780 [Trichosporon asahii var. asahii CBS 2479]|uniref:F-box domain-containing protein n=1 Tax=Trichosporon asahii var. asahii (strain ATCC 90039 / CBS 2479 / JCM 2466 / KCTC 7840 / NBRC 103889/ NCYC 2677 / UAMH 7654) TaxID=1186058 RepID=J5QC81_TRIAS|nr:hypothetical protein A1Q1_04780 [Trichosporon asahii var. asahii CBS 2479]EJT46603.1 hypothetical protein A1Q1_04780 [Trichosporon asahii var. asahii CBS 2479]